MRLSFALLLLPAAALAQDQKPFTDQAAGWFDKAKSYLSSESLPPPMDAAASKVAGAVVERITNKNWKHKVLQGTTDPNNGPGEWMIMFSGNTSCLGRCQAADQAFNESAAILASEISGPRLGRVDCDSEKLLCATWATRLPGIWHFLVSPPARELASAPSPLHIVPIHSQNVTTQEIVKIYTQETFREQPEYTGAYHPIDGWLQQYKLFEPLGYVMWGFGVVPSWVFMIVISFFSRQMMTRGGAQGATAGRPPPPTVSNQR